MRGYDVDEYDEYEDEGSGQEDEYEEEEMEEEAKPTAEEVQYLELRQKLKERYRKKIQKEASGCSQEKKKTPDSFGSFFGPSKPVIAQRVIQESKPLLEDKQLVARVLAQYNSKKSPSAASGSKPGVRPQPPRVSELKRKVEKIKNTRDYSFLLSDDTDLPAPSKQPPPKSVSTPRTEARPAKLSLQSKQASVANSRQMTNGGGERRPMMSSNGQTNPRAGPNKLASSIKPNTTAASNSKQLSSSNSSSEPGRPSMPNGVQSRKTVASMQRPSLPSSKGSLPSAVKPPVSKLQSSTSRQQLQQRRDPRELNRGEQRRDPRELIRDERRRDAREPNRGEHRRDPRELSRGEQRRDMHEPSRGKVVSRTPVSSAKPQAQSQMKKPQKPVSHDQRTKKRPGRPFPDDEEDADMAISMIRSMFRYNPNKFAGRDEDDSDMEVGFAELEREEKRSARIAKKEDEEQLRLIEEEEKRERMRKLKKQKMG